jgi:hypothetical protein
LAIPNIEERMSKEQQKRPIGLILAAGLIALEGVFVGALAAQLGLSVVTGNTRSLVSSVALFALVAAAAIWVIFIAVNLWRGRRWARSAGFFWQLVQLAIATGSFGGQFGSQAIGWALVMPSLAVMIALLSKKVVAATMDSADTSESDTQ